MNRFSCLSIAVLMCAVACGDSGEPEAGGEIQSQEDVAGFFQAVAPELISLFNELADQQSAAAAGFSTKEMSSIACPEGGSLNVDTDLGSANLFDCSARGIIINASLFLAVFPTGPGSYQASFSGPMTISGNFTGTIEVLSAFIEWSNPATEDNTYWEVTVDVDSQIFIVTSAGSGNGEGGETRIGGSCVPGQQGDFSCTSTCLEICLPEEVAQSAFCAGDSVCECFCVNYNL